VEKGIIWLIRNRARVSVRRTRLPPEPVGEDRILTHKGGVGPGPRRRWSARTAGIMVDERRSPPTCMSGAGTGRFGAGVTDPAGTNARRRTVARDAASGRERRRRWRGETHARGYTGSLSAVLCLPRGQCPLPKKPCSQEYFHDPRSIGDPLRGHPLSLEPPPPAAAGLTPRGGALGWPRTTAQG
jgi:hypothetical protein